MAKKTKATSAEEKLRALYDLQLIDSRIDRLRVVRGELPLEVEDLEDELAGLESRLERLKAESDGIKSKIHERKESIIDSGAAIKRFEEQQNSVRNNREFESLNKEIEYQSLGDSTFREAHSRGGSPARAERRNHRGGTDQV